MFEKIGIRLAQPKQQKKKPDLLNLLAALPEDTMVEGVAEFRRETERKMAGMSGGCSCGSLRFEISDYLYVIACHCDACKKRTGTAFGVSVVAENSMLDNFEGTPKTYVRTADSGKSVDYEFCPDCGTTIRWKIKAAPTRQMFAAGAFDDTRDFMIDGEMYNGAALPWVRIGCQLSRADEPDNEFRSAMMENSRRRRG